MTKEQDRVLAESVLKRLMVGSYINGMRFFTPQILMEGPSDIGGESFINLTSDWAVFEKRPDDLPNSVSEISDEDQLSEIIKIRGEKIIGVEILKPWPHLVISFKSGKILFLNGKDHQYEPWTAGLNHLGIEDQWLVVACPGGGLAVWAPKNFELK
jgi:hypothetical protein